MAMDPELASSFRRMPRLNPASPIVRGLFGVLLRVAPMKRAAGASLRKVRKGGLYARLHSPVDAGPSCSRGALLWIHGGGLVLGDPRQDDVMCSKIAATLGIVVLAPRYRLAPQHRFPAALDDCRAAYDWLVANAGTLGIDPTRIAIGGDSAGGGLAASLVQLLSDEKPGSVAAQWLLEPMLDDRTGADGRNDDPPEYFWKAADNRFGWGAYLGMAPGSLQVPRYAVAARYEGTSALPPAWIGVGMEDLFLDECRAYARRLQEAGGTAELVCVPGAPHGFFGLAPKAAISQRFLNGAVDWLRKMIGA